jgi:ribose 5-phosphate isomerase B
MKIAIASDHGGYELKEVLKTFLVSQSVEVVDLGTPGEASVDYPDYGIQVSERVSKGEVGRGVLVCGTGIGMSVVANKFPRVRAALVHDLFSAKLSREHNDANILVLGGRVVGKDLAKEILRVWLETPFAGGRHQKRLDKITALEKKNFRL